jgi:hypothetical protein
LNLGSNREKHHNGCFGCIETSTWLFTVIARLERAIQGPCDRRLMRLPLDGTVKAVP